MSNQSGSPIPDYLPGEIVQLSSGGPPMTVEGLIPEIEALPEGITKIGYRCRVACLWFDGTRLMRHEFPEHMIRRVEHQYLDGGGWTESADEVAPQGPVPVDSAADSPIWHDRLVFDFEVSDSSPVIKGTWVTADAIVSHVVDGDTWSDILKTHPELTEDDIYAAMAYSLDTMNEGQGRDGQ